MGGKISLAAEHRHESYKSLDDALPERQMAVLRVISRHGEGVTNAEIARILGVGVNQVTGRTFELRERGLVESFGSRFDPFTKRNVTVWKVKGSFVDWLRRRVG